MVCRYRCIKGGRIMEEIVCKQDEDVFEYTFTVTGQFYGDKDEVINKGRI